MNKLIITAIVSFMLGFVATRAGQKTIITNYNVCVEENAQNAKTVDEILAAMQRCNPSKIVQDLFFW